MRVLLIGSTGMLGSMLYRYFSAQSGVEVVGTSRAAVAHGGRLPLDAAGPIEAQLEAILAAGRWDYWINCIGIIKPYCRDGDAAGVREAIRVNADFPHRLAACAKREGIPVIQVATDCVYSGTRGGYTEADPHDAHDVYGKTKSLGEVFDGSVLNLRVSIIGPELGRRSSLLEWFLCHPAGTRLPGYVHHRWNGISTLRFARLCDSIMRAGAYHDLLRTSHVHHYVPMDAVSKYQLLTLFQEVFGTRHEINPVSEPGPLVDRTLGSRYSQLAGLLPPISIRDDVAELAEFIRKD